MMPISTTMPLIMDTEWDTGRDSRMEERLAQIIAAAIDEWGIEAESIVPHENQVIVHTEDETYYIDVRKKESRM
jgi:hypothetical protein